MRQGSEYQASASNGRGGKTGFVDRVLAENLEFRSGLQDIRIPILVKAEYAAIICPRRTSKAAARRVNPLFTVNLPPGLCIMTSDEAGIEQGVIQAVIDYGRGDVRSTLWQTPCNIPVI